MSSSLITIITMLGIWIVCFSWARHQKNGNDRAASTVNSNYLLDSDEEVLAVGTGNGFTIVFLVLVFVSVIVSCICISGIEMEKKLYYPYHEIDNYVTVLVCSAICCVVSLIAYLWYSKMAITVTDKRICGFIGFGKRVDLPLDSISAVGVSMFQGIAVGTSSGRIVFSMIKNRDLIHNEISNLLIQRQNQQTPVATFTQEIPLSNADEIKKYKELLDMGVITQDEFDAKKKQLLGL